MAPKAPAKNPEAVKPATKTPKAIAKPKAAKPGNLEAPGKDSKGKGGAKGGKKKGKRGKKKRRCPIKRRKKALKRKCTDMMVPTAMLNLYYISHGIGDALKTRKFIWKKKKK